MTLKQRGFSLVELMIAITIAIFLLGGLMTLVQAMKSTSGTQSSLSQLQDNERFATDLLSDVIQAAGDYPSPFPYGLPGAFAAISVPTAQGPTIPFAAGQTVAGLDTGGATGSFLAVRYTTAGTAATYPDALISCNGNTSPTQVTFINVFSIDSNNNLQCQLTTVTTGGAVTTSAPMTLVNGVSKLTVLYGVKTNATSSTLSADAYLTATQINALPAPPALPQQASNGWALVKSVQLVLTVVNPLAAQPGQPATLSVMRVINVMNQVGEGET